MIGGVDVDGAVVVGFRGAVLVGFGGSGGESKVGVELVSVLTLNQMLTRLQEVQAQTELLLPRMFRPSHCSDAVITYPSFDLLLGHLGLDYDRLSRHLLLDVPVPQ